MSRPVDVLKTTDRLQSELARAMRALQAHDLPDAEAAAAIAFALAPTDLRVLKLQAAILQRSRRFDAALEILERALASAPDDALLHNSVGISAGAAGKPERALAAFRRATDLAPEVAALRANLGKALVDQGDLDGGIDALVAAIAGDADLIAPHYTLAYAYRIRGLPQRAVAVMRDLVARHPREADAWVAIAELAPTSDDVGAIKALLGEPQLTEEQRIELGFALARALERNDGHAEAWQQLVVANARVQRREPWDRAASMRRHASTLDAFEGAPASASTGQGAEIIFIVGMPRSGSTLIEQILASHPEVEGAGEIDALTAVLGEESRRRGMDPRAWARAASEADWLHLGQDYLQRTARWRIERPRSTDKLPDNWLWVGAIRRMLPGARVVVSRRDPFETAFGCYARRFTPGRVSFSYDFDDLAAYWRDVERGVRQWVRLHPHAVREQHYEALVADPDAQIRALLAFCDLAFDARCVDFHATERLVRTQSAEQVRTPLHAASARVPRYGEVVADVRRAFERATQRPSADDPH